MGYSRPRMPIFLFFLLLTFPVHAGEKLTLMECYRLALQRSETVAISDQEIARARAQYEQVIATMLPKITATVSELLQQQVPSGSGSSVQSTFTRFSRPKVAIGVAQPLFQGFKNMSALRSSHASQAQAAYLKADAERFLFADVARTFQSILKLDRDIATSTRIISISKTQVVELNRRFALGKTRASELAAQEAIFATEEAALEKARGDRAIAYEAMSFLTGLDPQPAITSQGLSYTRLKPLEDYLAQGNRRPDLLASEEAITIAKEEIRFRKADFLPNATAEFNYYPYRVGFQSDIHWDALFSLTVPLFDWGKFGILHDSQARAKQAELRARGNRRIAESDIKKAYTAYHSSLKQLNAYTTAVAKSEESYRLQNQDYALGLIPYTESLTAQQVWINSLHNRDSAELDTVANWTALQIVSGAVP